MKSDMRALVEELEKAINESVCESDRIAAIVSDMKRAGYDLTLVLEATIGLTAVEDPTEPQTQRVSSTPGRFELTAQDQRFLSELHISSGE